MKKNILFVTYGGGHAPMVLRVIEALRSKSDANIQVLAMPSAKEIFRKNGIATLGFADYLDPKKDADAIGWGTELAKTHHSPTIGATLEDSIAYLGLCYMDLVVRLGEKEAEAQFAKKSRHAFYPLTVMERAFDVIKPDFVISTNSPRSEAAAIEVANNRKIGTMVMTDLLFGISDYSIKANHITFLCELAIKMFMENGYIDDSISQFYITGNPALDKILSFPKEKDPQWIERYFPEAAGRPIVFHADMPAYLDPVNHCGFYKTEAMVTEELDAAYQAARASNAFYVVRPHPSQDRNFHINWLKGKPDAKLAMDCDLLELLRNVDMVVVRTSTVGLQAVYMHKKILQLSADYHTDLPLANMGIAWGVNSYDEVEAVMREALNDTTKIQRMVAKTAELFPLEPAAGKIAGIILDKIG